MTDRTTKRIQEIRRRTRQKRRKLENRVLSSLTLCSLCFMAGLQMIFARVRVPAVSTVAYQCGTVLLQEGTSSYVVTAILFFTLGAGAAVFGIKYKKRKKELKRIH